jgi:steroid delta-isomerase-like uncharacterized protein
MSEKKKMMDQRLYEQVWNQGNLDVIDELTANDFISHLSPDDEFTGPEGMKQFVSTMREAFPDVEFTIEDQITEGDRVVTRWTASATHRGEYNGLLPTGKQVEVPGITIMRVADDKFVEGWTNWGVYSLLEQLGVIPAAERA